MANLDRITDLWWAGVRLWYNEQDFLQAMQSFDEAIDSIADDIDIGRSTIVPKETTNSAAASLVAPLLLFLAGCHLDAGEIQRARSLCRQCLATKTFSENDVLAFQTISEYSATFHEDESIAEPWKMAYQIAEWAIQKRQSASNDSSNWRDPFQRPGFFYFNLVSKPIYPREEHPSWCRRLEEHYPIIRDEYQSLLQRRGHSPINDKAADMPQHWPKVGAGDHRDGAGQHDASVVQDGGEWREVVLFGSGARPDLAPKTCRLLETLAPTACDLAQEGAGEIIFSVLAPSTHITPHCASTNLRLTAHMGLQIPSQEDTQCYIQIGNEKLCWEPGKIIVFDDSYQHEVHNHTREIRAVLLLRFWHPNLENRQHALQKVLNAKDMDRQRRCNPPLPPNGTRNPQGMNQRMCPTCGRSGFESIRLVRPEDSLFVCICGREVVPER